MAALQSSWKTISVAMKFVDDDDDDDDGLLSVVTICEKDEQH